MDDTTKAIITSLVKSLVDKAVIASGVALVSHGLLVPAQLAGYDQIMPGLVMILLGVAWGWYREHLKGLVDAECNKLNQQIADLTKQIQQGQKPKT